MVGELWQEQTSMKHHNVDETCVDETCVDKKCVHETCVHEKCSHKTIRTHECRVRAVLAERDAQQ